ncbi:MAG: helix-turn-helix domain-containing protein [Verrucomicrobia bacterium]|nr:helix-turn-helix domain-containing protein [Verrucomicrobiota bacterium]
MKRSRVAIISSFARLGQWRGIMRFGQQAGWICQRIDRDTLSLLNTWNPDGVLFQVDEFDTPVLNFVRNCKLPKVGLRALPGSGTSTPLVLPDLTSFGRQIATHFVARNFRRLCYLGPKSDESANAGCTHFVGMQEVADAHGIRLEGFFPDQASTWKALGLPYRRRSSSYWDRFWELGPALIDHLMQDAEPVGLFCAFGEPAMQFMEMVDERKLAIPAQIGMAAETEDALNGLVTKVPMTCLVPDYELQGFEAAQLLDRVFTGKAVAPDHRTFISECDLVLRASSNQIVTSDPLVGHILEQVRKNAFQVTCTPESLAHELGCSLRMIQIRFRKSLRRGIAEIIREQRIHRAAELIRKTDLPMKHIVEECGFSGHHQLERAVRMFHGISPSALRKNQGEGTQPRP